MSEVVFVNFSSASLPILILIGIGYLSRKLVLRDAKIWEGLDKINFRLLIPALVIGTIAPTDIQAIAGIRIGLVITLVLISLTVILVLLYLTLVPSIVNKESFSSIFQTSTRWNASIALVVSALFFEPIAITVIAIIMVVFMPIVNVINIYMMARFQAEVSVSLISILSKVIQNPIIIGCITGILLSASQMPLPGFLLDSLSILGKASTGTILLGLGAGIGIGGFQGKYFSIFTSCTLKLMVMPILVLLLGLYFEINREILIVAVVAMAMPTATNGYVVAKEMGGDAPLYASCLTVQTLISLITVPIWILLTLQL